jgi:hypothetical protein
MGDWIKEEYFFEKMNKEYKSLSDSVDSFNDESLKIFNESLQIFIETYILSGINFFDEVKEIPELIQKELLSLEDLETYIQLFWNLQTGDIVPLDIIHKGGRVNQLKYKCRYYGRCYQQNLIHKLKYLHKDDDHTVLWVVGVVLDLQKIKLEFEVSSKRKKPNSKRKKSKRKKSKRKK